MEKKFHSFGIVLMQMEWSFCDRYDIYSSEPPRTFRKSMLSLSESVSEFGCALLCNLMALTLFIVLINGSKSTSTHASRRNNGHISLQLKHDFYILL